MIDALSESEVAAARAVLAGLTHAWKRGDGSGFAAAFSDDADFVNILGAAFRGRAAIAAQHQLIFDTIYQGSRAVFELAASRKLAPDFVLAQVAATLEAPAGPRPGLTKTLATAILVKAGGTWRIAAFHNTVVGPPPGGAAPT